MSCFLLACHPPGHDSAGKVWDRFEGLPEVTKPLHPSLAGLDLEQVDTNSGVFWIEKQSQHLNRWPCSGCHPQARPVKNEPAAHWDISLRHADEQVMNCGTCHDARSDMNQLHSLQGLPIDMNRADRVCAQCHTTQVRDWLGGAHGKRLARWEGPAIRFACTQCHDPHQPAWDQRWPQITAPRSQD